MRIVVQRVNKAKVTSNNLITGQINKGIMILVGLGQKDAGRVDLIEKYAKKILRIRLWNEILKTTQGLEQEGMQVMNEEGQPVPAKQPRSWHSNVMENGYGVLVVSQFTLFGKLKGNKPDFHDALNGEQALELFNHFVQTLRNEYDQESIQTGAFGQYMHIDMENDGPVTILLEEEDTKN